MTTRPPATDEEREQQPLTLRPTGTPVLDRSQKSLFPSFKTVGGRKQQGHQPRITRRNR